MANGQIDRLLEFASMQMAAEAFLARSTDNIPNRPAQGDIKTRLESGNTHASHFTPVQAEQFTQQYQILAQYRNDLEEVRGTGFSATLFKHRQTGELTLSIRSTEFLDDNVRDSTSTNKLEVKELGWAFGQIADMEAWYAELRSDPNLLAGKNFNVTGYSLGAHLATAFNILRREQYAAGPELNPVIATYTFNGAGTGGLLDEKRLTDLLADFNRIRANYSASAEWLALPQSDKDFLRSRAQGRVNTIRNEVLRIAALEGLKNPSFGNLSAPAGTQYDLGYQIAALLVARYTEASSNAPFLAGGTNWIPFDPTFAPLSDRFANMTEVVGMEPRNFAPSFVSNSGIHYGYRQEVHIEDQPLTRGNYVLLLDHGDVKANPSKNDLGDTHSLVLLIDSLALMAAMEKLAPTITTATAGQIFTAMSSAARSTAFFPSTDDPERQGRAEGDTLEKMLDALRKLVQGPDQKPTLTENEMRKVLAGNTWHLNAYRDPFHKNLTDLRGVIDETVSVPNVTFTFDALATTNATQLELLGLNPERIAYRYALKELNPFAVTGDTANAAFYNRFNVYGELDLYNTVSRTGELTAQWIADRSAFLPWKNIAYTNNTLKNDSGLIILQTTLTTEPLLYIDLPQKIILGVVLPGGGASAVTDARHFVFGGENSDVLTGGIKSDRLYGGSGNDYVNGGGDADYLEGGGGLDIYEYNTSAFTQAGLGDDGADLIRDIDGKGVLRVVYRPIQGGLLGTKSTIVADATVKVTDIQWKSADGTFIYTKNGADLQVTYDATVLLGVALTTSTITLKDFRDGDFGIRLGTRSERGIPTAFNYVFVGDFAPYEEFATVPANYVADPEWINIQTLDIHSETEPITYDIAYNLADHVEARNPQPGEPDINRVDNPNDSSGNDRILLVGGNDFFTGRKGGNDWVSGDIGRDVIKGGAGNDLLEGGPDGDLSLIGGDIVAGGAGDDDVYGNLKINGSVNMTLQQAIAQGVSTTGSGQKGDWLNGGADDDYIVGYTGNDVLMGGVGADVLVGGAGNDTLDGDDDYTAGDLGWTVTPAASGNLFDRTFNLIYNNNVLPLSGGADVLYGGAGNDHLSGIFGDDLLFGESGNDTMAGGQGSDVVVGGDDNDFMTGDFNALISNDGVTVSQGNDYLDGGAGNDWLQGEGGDDLLLGGAGNDALMGDASYLGASMNGSDYLAGDTGNDTLIGFGGNDILIGGTGNDFLDGGAGKDTYVFTKGDGVEIINDPDDIDGNLDANSQNTNKDKSIVKLEGINRSEVKFKKGSLLIDLGDGDAIHLNLPNEQTDPAAIRLFDQLQFDDGTVLNFEDVLEQGFDIDGTDDNDNSYLGEPPKLTGSSTLDRIRGFAGNDLLLGLAGNDVLDGGVGNDTLEGGDGRDNYVITLGDDVDRISAESDENDISFGPGITSTQLQMQVVADPGGVSILQIAYSAEDRILVEGSLRNADAVLHFDDGESLTIAQWFASRNGVAINGDEGENVLEAMRGNAVVSPGDGEDLIIAGVGNTIYRIDRDLGGRTDYILDFGGNDTIQFGEGIRPRDIHIDLHYEDDHSPAFTLTDALGGSIKIYRGEQGVIENYAFVDGTLLTHAQMVARRGGLPVLPALVSPQSIYQDVPLVVGGDSSDAVEDGDVGNVLYVLGKGDDMLRTYAGKNYGYLFRQGDGYDTITASGNQADDTIFFDTGITPESIRLSYATRQQFGFTYIDQFIAYGTQGDVIKVMGGGNFSPVERFQFADGRLYTSNSLNAYVNSRIAISSGGGSGGDSSDWLGTPGNDIYTNSLNIGGPQVAPLNNRVIGLGGNDNLSTAAGDDYLNGGPGSDTLDGGLGNDTYLFGPGYGIDLIVESSIEESNRIEFLQGINPALIRVSRSGDDLVVELHGRDDMLTVASWFSPAPSIETFHFFDGTTWNADEIIQRLSEVPDIVLSPVYLHEDQIVSVPLAADAFGVGDFSVTASRVDGSALPDWLQFDDQALTFTATPHNDSIGAQTIVLLASNGTVAPVAASIVFNVLNVNDAPEIAHALADHSARQDQTFSFTVPANSFIDVDAGDVLSYSVTLADGGRLPAWLNVEESDAILRFTGTPGEGDDGTPTIKVTATDADGAFVADTFDIIVASNADILQGTAGKDLLDGAAGDDGLIGAGGNDELYGGEGNDTLDGGTGRDYLSGGLGDDTYRFGRGYGRDELEEEDGSDIVLFNTDVNPNDVLVSTDLYGHALYLTIADTSDRMEVSYGLMDPEYALEAVVFADGTLWDANEIESRIETLPPTAFDDLLSGTANDDVIAALAGDDFIEALDGNDFLDGGAGRDDLMGGSGDDTYFFGRNYGHDTIYDWDGSDTLRFGVGIAPDDVVVGTTSHRSAVYFTLADGSDQIVVYSALDAPIFKVEQVIFDDGTIWDAIEIENRLVATQPTAFDDALSDSSGDDLIAALAGDDAVGAGLGSDILYGDAGDDYLIDYDNGGVYETIAPNYLDGSIGDDYLGVDYGSSILIGGHGNDDLYTQAGNIIFAFNRGDGRDSIYLNDNNSWAPGLPHVLSLGGGIKLSDLAFSNFQARVYSPHFNLAIGAGDSIAIENYTGLPIEWVLQIVGAEVRTYDLSGAVAEFGRHIENETEANHVGGSAQAFLEANLLSVTTDHAYGGDIAYQYAIKGNTDTLSESEIRSVLNEPGFGARAQLIHIANVNHAPELVIPMVDQSASEDVSFNFAILADTFADADADDLLTYAATRADGAALPAWLTFNANTRAFSGMPLNADVGTVSVKVQVTDGAGANVSDTFDISVANTNDTPTLVHPNADQPATEDSSFAFQLHEDVFADVDAGDSLTYSAFQGNGTTLPLWLSFNADTRTFSGTPENGDVGALTIAVTAADLAGATASDTFDIMVANTNDAPLLADAIADQAAIEDATFSFTIAASTFNDVDAGDTIIYGATRSDGSVLPSWIIFDTATLSFSGTPLNTDVSTFTVKVSATDSAGESAADSFDVTVANTNDAPTVANPIADQAAIEDVAFSFILPASTFNDVDVGDTLAYSAKRADDTELPAWLTFSAATRTFSGTPLNADVGTLTVKVSATDGAGSSVTDNFDISVVNTNDDPTLANLIIDQTATAGVSFNHTLPDNIFADVDAGDTLNYSVTRANGEALPSWLGFNAATRTFTGTPAPGDSGALQLKVIAADNAGATAFDTFDIVVSIASSGLTLIGTADNDNLTGGADGDLLSGLGGDDMLDGGEGADTMIGGLGNDSFVVNNAGDLVSENLNEGVDTVHAGLSYTLGANTEHLTLTGTNAIFGTGNALNNAITGNAADNVLNGGAGSDTLLGGSGNDAYLVDSVDDVVVENLNRGTDTVLASVNYILGNAVENLLLIGAALNGTGNGSDNAIAGNASNNILDGGSGADTLVGGSGDDTYVVDSTGDFVVEIANQGADTVQTGITYALGANFENLTLTGTNAINGTGNALDNVLTGNTAKNKLTGGDGNDTLIGGAGADSMVGGLGNDTYMVDATGDAVAEVANQGVDIVQASITYTLGANLENLILTGAAALNGTGNTLSNVITGNSGDNTLNGGAGADILAGAAGNDTYVVDNVADVVTENLNEGTDVIQAGVTYTLGANVENLTLTGNSASNGTGNTLDNLITGNAAVNRLSGGDGNDTLIGGAGKDSLAGGLGNDTYVVDVAGDTVTESANQGVDVVQTGITYTLGANVENLILTGTTNINGTGNTLDNVITGNSKNNTLNGLTGNDTFAGGVGNDTYRFDLQFGRDVIVENDAAAGNLDRIQFGAGITPADIALARLNDDLVLHTADQQNGIQILNWFTADASKVERVEFANGVTWNTAALQASAMQVVDMPGLQRGDNRDTILNGQSGNTVLEGTGGNDSLTDLDGNNLIAGGDGNDTLAGGSGSDLVLGAAGNDTISTGDGTNVVAFNRGGGADVVSGAAGAQNTLALGGGIDYDDLSLSKSGDDLVLHTGSNESVSLKDWYVGSTNQTMLRIQMILDATADFDLNSTDPMHNRRVQGFDFRGLVNQFDQARTANPGLSSWQMADALAQFHLSGSNSAALGGDLAYYYGANNSLTGISLNAAQQVIGAPGFGQDAQALRPFSGLQEGMVRLS